MYESNREYNLKNVLQILPGFDQEPLSDDYLTEGIKRLIPGGYEKGKEVHHVTGVDIAAPLMFGRSDIDKQNIGRRLHQHGVRYGNDMYNLAMLDRVKEHLYNKENWKTSNTVHSVLARVGIEDRKFVGDERTNAERFINVITQLPTSVIMDEVVPVFAEYVAGPSMEAAKVHNPNVTTLEENKRIHNEVEIPAERAQELALHEAEVKEAQKAQQDEVYDQLARRDLNKPATTQQKMAMAVADVRSDGMLSDLVNGAEEKQAPKRQRARTYAKAHKNQRISENQLEIPELRPAGSKLHIQPSARRTANKNQRISENQPEIPELRPAGSKLHIQPSARRTAKQLAKIWS